MRSRHRPPAGDGADATRLFDHPCFDGHEQLHFWHDPRVGLKAIAAIHRAGPNNAIGGCRMYPYSSEGEALADALRLSRAMSFKCAVADISMGGGKCVIIGDPRAQKTPALLRSMGRFIQSLNGQFYTGEDVGIGIGDVRVMREETGFLVGREGADSSLAAGYGVYVGIQACVRQLTGSDSIHGFTVAIQGLGQVGMALAGCLHRAGARLIVADVDGAAAARARDEFGARVAAPAEIMSAPADIFAPCALGGVISTESLPRFRCRIIAGAANNQLADPQIDKALRAQGILYAPDYVINAGGLINNALTLSPDFSAARVRARVGRIAAVLRDVFAHADSAGIGTDAAAAALAGDRLYAWQARREAA